jgi:protein TonB
MQTWQATPILAAARVLLASLFARAATGILPVSRWIVRYEREATAAAVVALHMVLVVAILQALRTPPVARVERETYLSLSPGGEHKPAGAPNVKLARPDSEAIREPVVETAVEPPSPVNLPEAAGGPAVTVPAEAMGDYHSVPPLPETAIAAARTSPLRLLLTIGADGSIIAAAIDNSSGSASADKIAIDWVKMHWRYKPALRDGQPVTVTTIATLRL